MLTMKKLDPKAVWFFFLQNSIGWIVFILFFSLCFGVPSVIGIIEESRTDILGGLALIYLVSFLLISTVITLLCYLFAKLTYSNYRYELKEDGFYKESGIITKKYVTIPYERIQNVDINRGIIARILGLSDLQIQTAGMSSAYGQHGAMGMGAEGRLPAVSESDALVIRDELIKRAKGRKENGGL